MGRIETIRYCSYRIQGSLADPDPGFFFGVTVIQSQPGNILVLYIRVWFLGPVKSFIGFLWVWIRVRFFFGGGERRIRIRSSNINLGTLLYCLYQWCCSNKRIQIYINVKCRIILDPNQTFFITFFPYVLTGLDPNTTKIKDWLQSRITTQLPRLWGFQIQSWRWISNGDRLRFQQCYSSIGFCNIELFKIYFYLENSKMSAFLCMEQQFFFIIYGSSQETLSIIGITILH